MAQKHTPGQLIVQGQCVYGAEGFIVARAYDGTAGYEDFKKAEANAIRIRACWNACEGINPEAVPEIVKALEFAREELAAAYGLHLPGDENEIILTIDAALAKAKEAS